MASLSKGEIDRDMCSSRHNGTKQFRDLTFCVIAILGASGNFSLWSA